MYSKQKTRTGADQTQTINAIPVSEQPSGNSKRRKCIIISTTLIILLLLTIALIILILSLTLFKSKKPITTVNSVVIKDINATINLIPFKVSINITLDITLFVKNPNKIGVTYRNSSAAIRFKGHEIGKVPIPGGKIGAGDTKEMKLTLTVFADRLVLDVDVYRDVIGGYFPVTTYTRISGKIRVLNLFNINVSSVSTCDLRIDVLNKKVVDQKCHYKNRL
ncbi:hypothetical protein QVD17_33762 [Tagetes erecta]|uniref:Late embryogenesis abundant protein LEA-2 subgroup domain-containing protein n=1 Tax=Tagetes erecta TaxID=13708 RepID=A0AAD8JZ62_TARER|nr:hypothetical protein QVD17_33762 [Tagetes erecta]